MEIENISDSNVLITGGTGFFGRSMLRYLKERSENNLKIPQITVISRNADAFLEEYTEFSDCKWLTLIKADILNKETLPKNKEYTHILHAATDSTFGPSMLPIERYNQIVEGTKNIIKYSIENNIKKFLLTSSGGVYGPQPYNLKKINEDYNGIPDPLNIQNTYSIAKRCAEHICKIYSEGTKTEVVIARCFSFVGQDLPLKAHFAIGNFINDALNEKIITIKGSGTEIRTYLDQRELAEWLLILLFKGENGNAYNVGSDLQISIKELAYLIRNLLAPDKEVKLLGQEISQNRNIYIPNIEKIKKYFEVEIKYSIEQSILEVRNKIYEKNKRK